MWNDGEREVRAPLFQSRGKKIYIHSRRYPHAFLFVLFFFLEFPQPPGGVMTRRTVFTRQIITVESVFSRSDWLLYP